MVRVWLAATVTREDRCSARPSLLQVTVGRSPLLTSHGTEILELGGNRDRDKPILHCTARHRDQVNNLYLTEMSLSLGLAVVRGGGAL